MQLDADQDDEPFFKPAVVQTEPLIPKSKRDSQQQQQQQQESGGPQDAGVEKDDARHAEAEAAATATAEQEE